MSRFSKIIFLIPFILLLNFQVKCQDTITVMYYNILNFSSSNPYNINTFKQITSYIKPDILVLNEVDDEKSVSAILKNVLNTNGNSKYKSAQFTDGPDTDNMLFYNGILFNLTSENFIPTSLRHINHYKLFYNKSNLISTDSVFINCYSAHLKAGEGSTNESQRHEEIKSFKNYVQVNTDARNILFGGDLNFYGAYEPALLLLIDSGSVRFADPIDSIGNWHENPLYAALHTQSTRNRQFGGGSTGGLDDRFDFIFASNDILSGKNNIHYLQGSYSAFGNDGKHFNDSITALPINPNIPPELSDALHNFSDHLPVVMKIVFNKNSFGINSDDVIQFTLSPNPAKKAFIIKYELISEMNIQINVIDNSGKKVFGFTGFKGKGMHIEEVFVNKRGLYFVSISGMGKLYTKKIIIL